MHAEYELATPAPDREVHWGSTDGSTRTRIDKDDRCRVLYEEGSQDALEIAELTRKPGDRRCPNTGHTNGFCDKHLRGLPPYSRQDAAMARLAVLSLNDPLASATHLIDPERFQVANALQESIGFLFMAPHTYHARMDATKLFSEAVKAIEAAHIAVAAFVDACPPEGIN